MPVYGEDEKGDIDTTNGTWFYTVSDDDEAMRAVLLKQHFDVAAETTAYIPPETLSRWRPPPPHVADPAVDSVLQQQKTTSKPSPAYPELIAALETLSISASRYTEITAAAAAPSSTFPFSFIQSSSSSSIIAKDKKKEEMSDLPTPPKEAAAATPPPPPHVNETAPPPSPPVPVKEQPAHAPPVQEQQISAFEMPPAGQMTSRALTWSIQADTILKKKNPSADEAAQLLAEVQNLITEKSILFTDTRHPTWKKQEAALEKLVEEDAMEVDEGKKIMEKTGHWNPDLSASMTALKTDGTIWSLIVVQCVFLRFNHCITPLGIHDAHRVTALATR